jgi:hypothetical protein
MKTKAIITILVLLAGAKLAVADVVFFDSGHHIWTENEPYYDEVFLRYDASLDFLGGSIGQLSTFHNSLADLEGGQMTYGLWTFDNSLVHYYNGDIGYLLASDNSIIYLYAHDVQYHSTGGIIGNGAYVEGFFNINNQEFNFSLYNSQYDWQQIQIVPEPATIFLLGFGCLFLRWKSGMVFTKNNASDRFC